jgi:glycosyltransferase involved in cell wall biosynthesis
MNDRPGASECVIVVPTLGNRLGYLEEALRSIRDQDAPVDVVMVTPESADGARQLAERFEALVVNDPGGLSAAVNAGLAKAGPAPRYGNWLGDDDLLVPGSISAGVACLSRSPDNAVAYGHCSYIDGRGHELWISRAGRWAPRVLGWGPNLIPQPGMLFRLDDFWAVGGLDESLKYSMDLDLLLRLKSRGRLVDLGRPVSSFRWHADSLTVSDRHASLAESEAVKRRYLSRLGLRLRFLWERPVRFATMVAVRSLSRRGMRATGGDG